MDRTTKLLATTMIAAAGAISAALTLSATAAAEPAAPPTIPGVPGLPLIDQLASAPAWLPSCCRASPRSWPGFRLRPPHRWRPRRPPVPRSRCRSRQPRPPPPRRQPRRSPPLPGLAPATAPVATAPLAPAAAPATAPGTLVPTAEVNVPQVPFLPVPLPQQVSFPGDLASLLPAGFRCPVWGPSRLRPPPVPPPPWRPVRPPPRPPPHTGLVARCCCRLPGCPEPPSATTES